MQKTTVFCGIFYLIGLLVLALGITLNTKVGLGVSPIISVSYSISEIWRLNFGNVTLLLYGSFVVVEMVLHVARSVPNRKQTLVKDALQFPLSLVFTRFLNLFGACIPSFQTGFPNSFLGSLPGRVLFLCVAIACTGIGAAMSLNVRMIPNPGDGIVQAMSDSVGKSLGLTKNFFDLFNICLTICIGLVFTRHIIGIGLGTVLAVIGVGRTVAVFNHFCLDPMLRLSGLETPAAERAA